MKNIIPNLFWLFGLLIFSFIYLLYVAEHVPQEYALFINMFVFPIILGVIGAWVLEAPLYVRLFVLLLIPISHLLYFGGDPAKPGLENVIIMVEGISIWIGVLLFYFVNKYFLK